MNLVLREEEGLSEKAPGVDNVPNKTIKTSVSKLDERIEGQELAGSKVFSQRGQHVKRLWGESMACRNAAELNMAGAPSARSCVVEMEEVGETGCGPTVKRSECFGLYPEGMQGRYRRF